MSSRIILKKREEDRLLSGHPWIFDNEIQGDAAGFEPGQIVDIHAAGGRFLGRGFINPASKIRVRLLTRQHEEIDGDFFRRRIEAALAYRKRIGAGQNARLIFAEADMIPGLVVDGFTDAVSGRLLVSLQTLALGIDRRKEIIVGLLGELLRPAGIFERNDAPVREREGLPLVCGQLAGDADPELTIEENGIRFRVNVVEGQKTGHFLDQRENRTAIEPFCREARVLDAFCHTGGFSLHALRAGARSVTAADISAAALAYARRNAKLNGFSGLETVEANVFDYLRQLEAGGERFGLIVLDPPAFAKSRSALAGAYRGYKDINLRAMRLLEPGGILVTCSCSFHMRPDMFRRMLTEAAADTGRTCRLVEMRYQAKDHPVLLGYPESEYLKCALLQVS